MTATDEDRLGALPGAMHISVRPQNEHELARIHGSAESSALYYVLAIVGLYLLSLLVVIVHYMNAYYGSWAWNADDIWTEFRDVCCRCSSNSNNSNVVVGPNEVSVRRRMNGNTEEEEESNSSVENEAKQTSEAQPV